MLWTIVITPFVLLISLASYYLQTGVLATLGIVVAFLIVAYIIINLPEKRQKKLVVEKNDDNDLSVYTSSEAVSRADYLCSELRSLVSRIAVYQANKAGKLVTFAEVRVGLPKEKLISLKDMDAAFLEAIKELQAENSIIDSCCVNACDKESLLEKIQRLRKKYEK